MTRTEAETYREHLNAVISDLNDESALNVTDLFPLWLSGKAYIVADRVRYDDILYKCVQGHTSQEDWTPDITPALWVRVSVDEWPEWVQPTGAQDAYNKGDKVSHDGKHWISDVDANTWMPGVYGWSEA